MIVTIESTDRLVTVNGIPARIWEGSTESGCPVVCCVMQIAVPETADAVHHAEFERGLSKASPPATAMAARAFDARMIL